VGTATGVVGGGGGVVRVGGGGALVGAVGVGEPVSGGAVTVAVAVDVGVAVAVSFGVRNRNLAGSSFIASNALRMNCRQIGPA
jgi:hypothetical protein